MHTEDHNFSRTVGKKDSDSAADASTAGVKNLHWLGKMDEL
jgi:hypothetical protein